MVRTVRQFRPAPVALVAFVLWVFPYPALGKTYTYKVRHLHTFGSCQGKLVVGENDIRYDTTFRQDARIWSYTQIRHVERGDPRHLSILTYEDQTLQLGRDRPFNFEFLDGNVSDELFNFVATRAGRREPPKPPAVPPGGRYEIAVKHLHLWGGCEGTLKIGPDLIEYMTPREKDRRLWKYLDIKQIASEGAYRLSLQTYEDQMLLLGRDKVFEFQLKEPLEPIVLEFMRERIQR